MKTIFFEIKPEEKVSYEKIFPDAIFYEDKLSSDNINVINDAEIICVFINSEINKEIIDSLPHLKYIVTRSTGYDHIDVAYAKEKNIVVSNVPSYGSNTVAEFTFGLILNMSRNIFDGAHRIKEGNHFDITNLRGFDLKGKTIGVIGTGRIGKNVIRMAQGFMMQVIAYDPFADQKYAEENNFKYVDLEHLIGNSDIITLHTPYTKENHHFINKDKISKMKKGVIIANTARGELIDTEALIWGIKENIVAQAGLDVLEGERQLKEETDIVSNNMADYKTLLEDHVLFNMPQVTVTPHIAFYTKEAEGEIIDTTIKNIEGFKNNNILNTVK